MRANSKIKFVRERAQAIIAESTSEIIQNLSASPTDRERVRAIFKEEEFLPLNKIGKLVGQSPKIQFFTSPYALHRSLRNAFGQALHKNLFRLHLKIFDQARTHLRGIGLGDIANADLQLRLRNILISSQAAALEKETFDFLNPEPQIKNFFPTSNLPKTHLDHAQLLLHSHMQYLFTNLIEERLGLGHITRVIEIDTTSWLVDFFYLASLKLSLQMRDSQDSPEGRRGKMWIDLLNQCFAFMEGDKTILVIEKPTTLKLDARLRLHCDDGPAVAWADGFAVWAIHGVLVPAFVVAGTETVTCQMALAEPNVEIRRIMIDKIGMDRFIEEGMAKLLHQDNRGKLWRLPGVRTTMVELINSTQEVDGTHKHYFLRVPPRIRTASAAVAWTFSVDEYNPVTET